MKVVFNAITLIIFMLYYNQAFALHITSPDKGQIVYQGDRITVLVKPDTGEDWKEVRIEIVPMSYNVLTNEYKAEIEIPRDETTGVISFSVAGYKNDGTKLLLERSLFVKMPPNVVMQSIVAGGSGGGRLVVLEKMPLDSSAVDIENFEREQLSVYGRYSDNVNRELTSSASGTTYKSSDELVATVSPEGNVTVQGIGKANITVINGTFRSVVDVVVKPYGN